MSIIRILIFVLLIYFAYTLVKTLFLPKGGSRKNVNRNPNVKIFKKGDVEKSRFDMDSEDVDFVEIEDEDEKPNQV